MSNNFSSKHLNEDLSFMSEVDAALINKGSPWAYFLSILSVVVFILFVVWMIFSEKNEKTRGEGQIVPSKQLQPVQSVAGGVVKKIFVKEGDIVEAGDPLVQISNVKAINEFQSLVTKKIDLEFTLRRLQAEMENSVPVFTEDEMHKYPGPIEEQLFLYDARTKKVLGEVKQSEAELQQKKTEISNGQERRAQIEEQLLLLRQKEKSAKPLWERGIFSTNEYVDLTQRIKALESQLDETALSINKAMSSVSEAEEKLRNIEPMRLASIAAEMDKSRKELQTTEELLIMNTDERSQSEITALFRGTVNRILVKEEAVVRSADLIMEVLPLGEGLEVEARFSTQDRSYLVIGKEATVSVSAYDPIIYGSLKGKIIYISADTIEDSKGQPWYVVRLNTEKDYLTYEDKELPILVGMTVSVDVISGSRSMFTYLTKPILKSQRRTNIVGKEDAPLNLRPLSDNSTAVTNNSEESLNN